MHPAKGAQEIACARPHAFRGVNVNLAQTIAVIVACPFVFAMLDRDSLALNLIVALPFIRIRHGLRERELGEVLLQGLAIGVFRDA